MHDSRKLSKLKMYNKTFIEFDFCDIKNYECLEPLARLITLTLTNNINKYQGLSGCHQLIQLSQGRH